MIWKPRVEHRTVAERRDHGKSLRETTPRSAHAWWKPSPHRASPVALIESQNADRIPQLIPVRRWRMQQSAFTFYRGTAIIMASDLSTTPSTGVTTQLCGDAHLSNFGMFASAERKLVFDVNDFDESLPGPWEWDIKRLASSFTIASRHIGHDTDLTGKVTKRVTRAYREAMLEFAEQGTLDIWYAQSAVDGMLESLKQEGKKKRLKRSQKAVRKAETHTSLKALSKLAHTVDGEYRIKSDPPVLIPVREATFEDPEVAEESIHANFAAYRSSLRPDRRVLLDKFTPIDLAHKVVGVGSVGNRSFVLLLMGRDDRDPLFLQIKQANRSVLEPHLSPGPFKNHGARVIAGQQLMQASSDIFLGWSSRTGDFHYYWRQLRDWKYSFDVSNFRKDEFLRYADACGRALARSHARSGDPVVIAGYLGKSDTFDEALVEFASAYADQNDRDYAAFVDAIERGELETERG